MIKECKMCGCEFQPKKSDAKICSKQCRLAVIKWGQEAKIYANHTNEYKAKWAGKKRDRGIDTNHRYWCTRVVASIKYRDPSSELTTDWLEQKLNGWKCEATGLPFHIQRYKENPGFDKHPLTPSVDKVDPTKGYRKDNCRLVVWIYNRCKGKYSHYEVLEFARALVAANDNKVT
jgi:hypothetical protein